MLLGVILFFDAALLALGNVLRCLDISSGLKLTCFDLGFILVGTDTYYWAPENILLLRSQTKAPWHRVLHRRYPACLYQVAVGWCHSGNLWFFEPVWVRSAQFHTLLCCF